VPSRATKEEEKTKDEKAFGEQTRTILEGPEKKRTESMGWVGIKKDRKRTDRITCLEPTRAGK